MKKTKYPALLEVKHPLVSQTHMIIQIDLKNHEISSSIAAVNSNNNNIPKLNLTTMEHSNTYFLSWWCNG